MTTARTDHHSELSAEYLRKARTHLAEDDLTQASEKGWNAAAVMVKAAAERRGWQHEGRRDLWQAIQLLVRDTGDIELRRLFPLAELLLINSSDDFLSRKDIEYFLPHVEQLIAKLDDLA